MESGPSGFMQYKRADSPVHHPLCSQHCSTCQQTRLVHHQLLSTTAVLAGIPAHASLALSLPRPSAAQAAPAQQMPMSRALANPLASAAPANSLPSANPPDIMSQPAAMQSLPPASAQPQQALPASSAGLAAALANLNPAQLNSLAGLLNQGAHIHARSFMCLSV